ncbi:MAG: creatininase family protein [Ktedonobacteraceae bacterium]|nr:creatininase family protein [Ktedonobacteraceae bacterium]
MLIEWATLSDQDIRQLDKNVPVIVPIGLVEAHGAHLGLGTDYLAAERLAREVCEATGAILCPTLPYGFADVGREYAGTVGVRAETLIALVADLCDCFCRHGFKKVIFLSGHGANASVCELGFYRAWEQHPDLQPACWNWWTIAGVTVHHGDEKETEIAMALSLPVWPERAQDIEITKPWHKERSRAERYPQTGGINGHPSRANAERAKAFHQQILQVLIERVRTACESPL